ncbi:unnamed protein product [Lampetra planeri]
MSKHQKTKNLPAVSSDDNETAVQLPPTPGAVGPVMDPTIVQLEGPLLVDMAAIPGGVETAAISQFPPNAQVATAILGAAAGSAASAGSSSLPCGESPGITTPAARDSADKGRRLPHVHEFVAAGGDWSTFRWRFEAAYKSVRWSKEEVLIALPTMLDDDALAVFRSISPDKNTMLTQAFAA